MAVFMEVLQLVAQVFRKRSTLCLLGETGSRNALNGFIDDFRITLGKARYTSNFTAPTEEFLAI